MNNVLSFTVGLAFLPLHLGIEAAKYVNELGEVVISNYKFDKRFKKNLALAAQEEES